MVEPGIDEGFSTQQRGVFEIHEGAAPLAGDIFGKEFEGALPRKRGALQDGHSGALVAIEPVIRRV